MADQRSPPPVHRDMRRRGGARSCSICWSPGGRWQTVTSMPVSSAQRWSSTFHSRGRYPLLPPPSAQISRRLASGYDSSPIDRHHWRMLSTAKAAVSSIASDVDPAEIPAHVVHAVEDGLADARVGEVVDVDPLRLAGRLPLPPAVGVLADQFLLIRIHRDDRLPCGDVARAWSC